jgi:small subunit ribosomal protein S6
LLTTLPLTKEALLIKKTGVLKKLKYVIQKKKTGFYHLLEFQADGKIINDLEVELKRDERVIRWQTVRLDKFALEYAERRKKKMSTNAKLK